MIPLPILEHPIYTTLLCVFIVWYLDNGALILTNQLTRIQEWFKK